MTLLVRRDRFQQGFEEIEKRLARFGTVESKDEGGATPRRHVSFLLSVPGYQQPTEAVLEYHERYRRSREGWIRDAYFFEYRPQRPRSRKAHHQHGAWGVHQHCEAPGRPSTEHYTDDERLLHSTHDEFVRLYLTGRTVSCVGLRRKETPRGGRRMEAEGDE